MWEAQRAVCDVQWESQESSLAVATGSKLTNCLRNKVPSSRTPGRMLLRKSAFHSLEGFSD